MMEGEREVGKEGKDLSLFCVQLNFLLTEAFGSCGESRV